MSLFTFDEQLLVTQLGELSWDLRLLFAVSCAERLFPAYIRYQQVAKRGDAGTLRTILDGLWDDLLRGDFSRSVAQDLDKCMALIPQEESRAWCTEEPWAEDAAACIAYSLRARQTGDPQEVAWAARRVYEAVDDYVLNATGQEFQLPAEEKRVLAHPVIQKELERQRRDLDELLTCNHTSRGLDVTRYRRRAVEERCIPLP